MVPWAVVPYRQHSGSGSGLHGEEGRGQRAEGRGQRAEGRGKRGDGGWRIEEGRWKIEVGTPYRTDTVHDGHRN